MSNGLFIGDKDPIEIRVGSRKATSVYYSGDNVPQNPVLHISAKGLTTEGIAESGGVTDLSGNGNNGTAYGGVEVVNDSEMGECFSFNGNGGSTYGANGCHIKQQTIKTVLGGKQNFSFGGVVKPLRIDHTSSQTFFSLHQGNGDAVNVRMNATNNKLSFEYRGGGTQLSNLVMEYGKKYVIYCVGYQNPETPTNTIIILYCDGVEVARRDVLGYSLPVNVFLSVGGYNLGHIYAPLIGLISEVKIFPYALTSEQVQALYRGIKKVWSNVPDGAILHLNAKGLTTEGIKQENGIPDLSGNGNHAIAYNGVSVVNDDDLGECFSLAGKRYYDYIRTVDKFDIKPDMTISFLMKFSGEASSDDSINQCVFSCAVTSPSVQGLDLYINLSRVLFEDRGYSQLTVKEGYANKPILFTIISDSTEHKYKIFINGILKATANYTFTERLDFQYLYFGGFTSYNNYRGLIGDIYVYPRALTAHEVKKLYRASRR